MSLKTISTIDLNILNSTTRLIQVKTLKNDYVTYDWFNRRLLTVSKSSVAEGKVDLLSWFTNQVIEHTKARIERVAKLRSNLNAYQVVRMALPNPYNPNVSAHVVRVDVPYYSFSDSNIINGNKLTMSFIHTYDGKATDTKAVELDFGYMFNKMMAMERHIIAALDKRKGKGGLCSSRIKKIQMIFDTTPAKCFPLVDQEEYSELITHLKQRL